jgi:hypothetical protein
VATAVETLVGTVERALGREKYPPLLFIPPPMRTAEEILHAPGDFHAEVACANNPRRTLRFPSGSRS